LQANTGHFEPDQVRVHCRCEMPYNPDEWMVECEKCYEWYAPHPPPRSTVCVAHRRFSAQPLPHAHITAYSDDTSPVDVVRCSV
jgi:hypothetical protein